MPNDLLQIPCDTADGQSLRLADMPAKAYLIVNTASECGFTPQYEGLEALWKTYHGRGLQVLGFPCNQFGGQEPGDAAQIQQFCQLNYGVTFPLLAKVEVNGNNSHPLFNHLKEAAPGVLGSKAIKWNFTKFLVSGDGSQVTRYGSATKPQALTTDIESLLG